MTASSLPLLAQPVHCGAVLAAFVAVLWGLGWLLVPRSLSGEDKLTRLAVVLASGVVFAAGVMAAWCCHRFTYLTVVPAVQIGAAIWGWRRLEPSGVAMRWTRPEVAAAVLIVAGAAAFFHLPYQFWQEDGLVRLPHADIGCYSSLVLSLPEAQALNTWATALGGHAVEGSGVTDHWYHWGAMLLAVAVRAVSGLPAVDALNVVAWGTLDVLLVVAAGACAGSICGGSLPRRLALGVMSLVALQWLRVPSLVSFIVGLTGEGYESHMRYSLALAVPYKYEGAAALAGLAAWLQGRHLAAVLLVFAAALGTPHVVATAAVSAGPLIVAGVLLRRRDWWQPALVLLALALGSWVVAILAGASFPKAEGQQLLAVGGQSAMSVLRAGAVDLLLTCGFGALSLCGLWHLASRRPDDPADRRASFAGALAVCGLTGAVLALQLMRHMPDSFHVMTLTQALLVMPLGFLGLVRWYLTRTPGLARHAVLAVAVVSLASGVDGLLRPVFDGASAAWTTHDVSVIRDELKGRPVGYLSANDRGWWISKHAFLGSVLESRVVRINPDQARKGYASGFYGAVAPFVIVPPLPGEPLPAWCDRYMEKLGIECLIETATDPLPHSLRKRCTLITHSGPLNLYRVTARSPSAPPAGAPPVPAS